MVKKEKLNNPSIGNSQKISLKPLLRYWLLIVIWGLFIAGLGAIFLFGLDFALTEFGACK